MRLLKIFGVILLSVLLNTSLYASIVGATKGSVDVSSGSLTYDLEIITPKGIAGLKPSVGINYNSSSNMNSLLGVGFSLAGLSSITKCNETLFSEKQDSSRSFNYCLDGQKLLLVDDSNIYGSNGSEYRTEINSQKKIIKKDDFWIVYSKDGLIYEYGNTQDSKDGNAFYKINQIADRYDNKIYFKYADTNDEQFISQISYANNKIDFIYEDRLDKKTIYSRSVKANINKRLKEISVKTDEEEVSSYKLFYEYNNEQSRITSLQECSMKECLEPVDFIWEEKEDLNYAPMELWLPNGEGTYTNDYITGSNTSGVYSALMDMNGDGLP
ncbi:hypothetical protein, partial [Sulfurospirillum arcachonense]|uniref:hypothetical protein n=1 Tax=Sulfurospirillum arcachonense TaxID=57666 RepID=UPI001C3F4DE0